MWKKKTDCIGSYHCYLRWRLSCVLMCWLIAIAGLLPLSVIEVHATIITPLYLPHLTTTADLIVKGEIASFEKTAEGNSIARIRVDLVLKSDLKSAEIKAVFPDVRVGPAFNGVQVPKLNDYGLFFLKYGANGIVPVDNQQFMMPVRRGRKASSVDSRDTVGRVRDELLYSLTDPADSVSVEAARQLGYFPFDSHTTATLKSLLKTDNLHLLGAVAQALLYLNQPEALPQAVRYLDHLRPERWELNDFLVLTAIKSLTSNEAVKELIKLLKHPDYRLKEAAAYALARTTAPEAIPALVSALDDPYREVRYQAVFGLANITLRRQWGPGFSVFQANEPKYITYWKQWWETEGKAAFQASPDNAQAEK